MSGVGDVLRSQTASARDPSSGTARHLLPQGEKAGEAAAALSNAEALSLVQHETTRDYQWLDHIGDSAAEAALALYIDALVARLGDRLHQVILFGSRARGNHLSTSDADIAVVVSRLERPFLEEKMALVELGLEALMDHGLLVQPWPFTAAQWNDPDSFPRFSHLIAAARREGRPLWHRQ